MNIRSIKERIQLPRKQVVFELDNEEIANNYRVSLLMSVREQWMPLDLLVRGKFLILDGPIADSNGIIIPMQDAMVNEVSEKIKNTIINDIPGFRTKIERIIADYQNVEYLDMNMAPIIDQALKGVTKQRFMARNDLWVYAKIIRRAMENGPYSSPEAFDAAVNAIFDDRDIISSFINEIETR